MKLFKNLNNFPFFFYGKKEEKCKNIHSYLMLFNIHENVKCLAMHFFFFLARKP